MSFRSPFLAAAALLLYTVLTASPGNADVRYVAGGGTGSAPCAATAPCPTLFIAHGVALPGDAIVCLSAPNGTGVTITKSITIDCSGVRAPVRDEAVNGSDNVIAGIRINIAVSSNDPLRTVRLRGLTIDGAVSTNGNFPSGRLYGRGIEIQAAAAVYIEDCVISNASQHGIYDHRTGGQTRLYIKDTVISGNLGPGIVAASAATGITVLDNVTSENNAYGIAVATGNNVIINRSVFSGNSVAGVEGDNGAQVAVNNSTISHNSFGVQSTSSVRLSNNDIVFNSTAFSGVAGTFGNNRLSGNSAIGTATMPLGSATSDLGQQ